MAKVFGQNLTKQQLMRRVGSLDTLAGIRPLRYQSGRAKGMDLYEVRSGDLFFTLNADKCLDMGSLYYKGMPLNFLARPGEMNPNWYSDGENAPRSITCGMFFTCGFQNVGPLQLQPGGRTYPQHGSSRTTPAFLHGASTQWDGDELDLKVTAEMREGELFGENIILRRTVSTRLGENTIHVHDEIENENVHEAPLMLMYHCNAGFPLLDAHSVLVFDAVETRCRDEVAKKGLERESCHIFGEPDDDFEEEVFYHKLKAENGLCSATMINPDLKLALKVSFTQKELPNLIQWKCKASGTYVTGIEPSNCYPQGLAYQKECGELRMLRPWEKIENDLYFTVLEGEEALKLLK